MIFLFSWQEKNASSVTLPDKKFDDMLELMQVLHPPNKEISGKFSSMHCN